MPARKLHLHTVIPRESAGPIPRQGQVAASPDVHPPRRHPARKRGTHTAPVRYPRPTPSSRAHPNTRHPARKRGTHIQAVRYPRPHTVIPRPPQHPSSRAKARDPYRARARPSPHAVVPRPPQHPSSRAKAREPYRARARPSPTPSSRTHPNTRHPARRRGTHTAPDKYFCLDTREDSG